MSKIRRFIGDVGRTAVLAAGLLNSEKVDAAPRDKGIATTEQEKRPAQKNYEVRFNGGAASVAFAPNAKKNPTMYFLKMGVLKNNDNKMAFVSVRVDGEFYTLKVDPYKLHPLEITLPVGDHNIEVFSEFDYLTPDGKAVNPEGTQLFRFSIGLKGIKGLNEVRYNNGPNVEDPAVVDNLLIQEKLRREAIRQGNQAQR